MAERLDAFLSHRGFGTRSQVRLLIRSGSVTVAGAMCRDQATHVDDLEVCVDGVLIPVGVFHATLLLHKPIGYACSTDVGESPILGELVPVDFRHLPMNPAGRLDRETSGLLVVTSEGNLIHALTNPRRHIPKRYQVLYSGTLHRRAVERCSTGILLEGEKEPTLPAQLILPDDRHEDGEQAQETGTATIILHEGRYHQVRRMFASLGARVLRLHRDRIGELDLPEDLPAGAARLITARELILLGVS
jgi:16S rRNA pseudouridine516 synthase